MQAGSGVIKMKKRKAFKFCKPATCGVVTMLLDGLNTTTYYIILSRLI